MSHQWAPICVEVANSQFWDKLGAGHHQEVQIQEKLELLKQHLQTNIHSVPNKSWVLTYYLEDL